MSVNKPTRTKIIVREGLTRMITDATIDTESKMKAIKELKQWMLRNDKTIRDVAPLIGIHFTTLNRLIHGKNVPYERTAYKIKEFLKKNGVKSR